MAFEVTIDSPAPVDEVLAALARDGREWRESLVPAGLREDGLYGVRVVLRGNLFRMAYRGGPTTRYRTWCPSVRGGVYPVDGGCQVRAEVGIHRSYMDLGTLWFVSLGLFILLYGRSASGLIPLGIVLVGAVSDHWHHLGLKRSDPAAAYLAERLRRVLQTVAEEHGGAVPPAGEPARQRNAR